MTLGVGAASIPNKQLEPICGEHLYWNSNACGRPAHVDLGIKSLGANFVAM